jgi:hypothetical protein
VVSANSVEITSRVPTSAVAITSIKVGLIRIPPHHMTFTVTKRDKLTIFLIFTAR